MLVRPTSRSDIRIDSLRVIESSGILCSIIDFSMARLKISSKDLVFRNLVDDQWLFEGDASLSGQYEVYRQMREMTKDCWSTFCPRSNLLWIGYIVKVLMDRLPSSKQKGQVFSWLQETSSRIHAYRSSSHLLGSVVSR